MATHDVTTFVQSLKDFEANLPPAQRALLQHIIASAQQSDETTGYGFKGPRTETPEQDDETMGYGVKCPRTEQQPTTHDDDTAGYGFRAPRAEPNQTDETAPAQRIPQDDDLWTALTLWLSRDDDTQGFAWKRF